MTMRRKSLLRIGLAVLAALVVTPILIFVLWPYRSESVVAVVGKNPSGCTVHANQISDWESSTLASGLTAEDVAYPLSVFVFVECQGAKPYEARLLPLTPGAPVVEGLECGRSPPSNMPCRLEAAPIVSRAASHGFLVRVTRRQGEGTIDIPIEVTTRRELRSIFFDVLMSV